MNQLAIKNPFEIKDDININNVNNSINNPKTELFIQQIKMLEINNNKSVVIPQNLFTDSQKAQSFFTYCKQIMKEKYGYAPVLKFKAVKDADKKYVGARIFKLEENQFFAIDKK